MRVLSEPGGENTIVFRGNRGPTRHIHDVSETSNGPWMGVFWY